MTTRRNKKRVKRASAAERRMVSEAYYRRRDELMEAALLGLDDGTTDSALSEELNFDKFLDEIDEAQELHEERSDASLGDRPQLDELKRHRERLSNLKVYYRRG